MGRWAARTDANQVQIVDALRRAGCSVQPLHGVGGGCPDLLVGFRGANLLMEIKDGDKLPSEQKMTGPQKEWHQIWEGQVSVVNSVASALEVVGLASVEIPLRGTIT